MNAEDVERFWSKVDTSGGPDACWPWIGPKKDNGYGQFQFGGKAASTQVIAHRAAFEMRSGAIPAGLQIDHLCRNRPCCNPKHHEPVTQRENLMRGETITAAAAARTHCINGHEFTPENTRRNALGHRKCRACDRERQRRYFASELAGAVPADARDCADCIREGSL
jgi:hypothetical protein